MDQKAASAGEPCGRPEQHEAGRLKADAVRCPEAAGHAGDFTAYLSRSTLPSEWLTKVAQAQGEDSWAGAPSKRPYGGARRGMCEHHDR